MKISKYKKYFPLLIGILIITPTLLLLTENIGRSFFIIFSILLWIGLCFYTKNYILSSLLYILFVLPFNITLLLPTTLEIFNTISLNIFPYIEGIYSNYLVPTISILDSGMVLLLLSFVFEKGFRNIGSVLKVFRDPLVIFLIFLIVQNIILLDLLVIFNSLRIILYIFNFILIINWIKKDWRDIFFKYVIGIFLFTVLIQGVIGILQFNGGASLGLSFLGESLVVNGMQGSSFIFLNDQIYLRAYGTFPHPNVLGGFFILSFVIGWICSINLKSFWKYISYSVMFLSVIFLLFTFSRICIVVMCLGVFLFFISKLKRNVLYSFSFGLIFERFMNLFAGGDASWVDRKNLIDVSFNIIKERFLFGTGFGNFVKFMDRMVPRTNSGILLLQPVHNVFLLSFSEFGILGCIPLFYILIKFLFRFVDWKKNIYLKIFIVLSLLIIGMFDHYLISLPQGMVISFLLLSFLTL